MLRRQAKRFHVEMLENRTLMAGDVVTVDTGPSLDEVNLPQSGLFSGGALVRGTQVTLTSGKLTIDAVPAGTNVDVTKYDTTGGPVVIVTVDGSPGRAFALSDVNEIVFNGSEFKDTFTNNTSIKSTAFGKGGNDKLNGGSNEDVLHGGAGDDVIKGRDGDDEIHGDAGMDVIHGGDNDDTIHGGSEHDTIWAGDGADTVHGGGTGDWIFGEGGEDELHGGEDGDLISGGDGNDTIYAGQGDDLVFGDNQNDRIEGGWGDDRIYGGKGEDTIAGLGNWNGYKAGLTDNDTLFGGYGKDTINGGPGNDFLDAGKDGAKLDSGVGYDFDADKWVIGGVSLEDVSQGDGPTCKFLARLASAALRGVDLASRIRHVHDGTYEVGLYDGKGKLQWVTVHFDGHDVKGRKLDGKRYTSPDPNIVDQGEFWTILYHRAYFQGNYGYAVGFNLDGLQALTGHNSTSYRRVITDLRSQANVPNDYKYQTQFWGQWAEADLQRMEKTIANNGHVVAGTVSADKVKISSKLTTYHAYTVIRVDRSGAVPNIELYNPHGVKVTVSWDEFKESMDSYEINDPKSQPPILDPNYQGSLSVELDEFKMTNANGDLSDQAWNKADRLSWQFPEVEPREQEIEENMTPAFSSSEISDLESSIDEYMFEAENDLESIYELLDKIG